MGKMLRNNLLLINFLVLILSCFSCDKYGDKDILWYNKEDVEFLATVEEGSDVSTRALTNAPVDITHSQFDVDFYIYEIEKDQAAPEHKKLGTYKVPSLYNGQLVSKEEETPLSWFSADKPHQFIGWTVPWLEEYNPEEEDIVIEFKDSYLTDWHYGKRDGSTVNLYYTDDDLWKNGKELEKLIGAVTEEKVYKTDGKYVPMQYKHLVSRIFITSVVLIDHTGAPKSGTSSNIDGNITFYGLPKRAILHTRQFDDQGNPMRPYVEMNDEKVYSPDQGLTFTMLKNRRNLNDSLYICPEVDFENISFKIELFQYQSSTNEFIPNTTYGKTGIYYGDFKSVKFSRAKNSTTGEWNDYDQGGDEKILHAGETMSLSIILYEHGIPGSSIVVQNWSSVSQETAQQYGPPGIYSDSDLAEIQSFYTNAEKMKELYETYGNGNTKDEEEGLFAGQDKGILPMYQDLNRNSYAMYVHKDYVLDGMGHTIKFNALNSNRVYIGYMRDVYLTSTVTGATGQVTYTVYIDKDGKVFLVDPVTQKMTGPTSDISKKTSVPFYLSLSTGT